MTRASGLAVLGGLIVFTVLFSLTRVVPAPDIDANLNIASHNSPQNRRDLGVSTKQIKKKLIAFIGVQTGFTTSKEAKYNYAKRRQALRETWFPDSQKALDKLEQDDNMVMRFVIGQTLEAAKEAEILAESRQYGGFLRLSLQEQYGSLTNKTLAFLQLVTRLYEPQYIVKADDDVYLRVDRIPIAVKQWSVLQSDYIGCMKTGQIMKSPEWRWYEPQHAVLGGGHYFTHAWGSIYVLSGKAAANIARMPEGSLRFFANEDVTLGSWMLALNVKHFDDRRLCEPWCTAATLAVYSIPECAGLCNPVDDLHHLHDSPDCRSSAATNGSMPFVAPIFDFRAP